MGQDSRELLKMVEAFKGISNKEAKFNTLDNIWEIVDKPTPSINIEVTLPKETASQKNQRIASELLFAKSEPTVEIEPLTEQPSPLVEEDKDSPIGLDNDLGALDARVDWSKV